MGELVVAGSITRATVPGGPLADLNIEAPGAYRVVSVATGGRSWKRDTAESRWVHGRVLVSARLDVELVRMVVRCYGATAAALDTNTAALVTAVSQWTYDLTVALDAVVHTWRCEPADLGPVDGDLDKFSLMAEQQSYVLSIPRAPVPLAGSI